MASRKPAGKFKPGSNVDFTPVIPKFLQGRMESNDKIRCADDSDGERREPRKLEMPEGKERPDLEDEAPTIVADDEIMALLEKQQVVVGDGKLEFKVEQTAGAKVTGNDSVVEFGTKARAKKSAPSTASAPEKSTEKAVADKNTKKRSAQTDVESSNPVKRAEKKKMLSFDDEEDL